MDPRALCLPASLSLALRLFVGAAAALGGCGPRIVLGSIDSASDSAAADTPSDSPGPDTRDAAPPARDAAPGPCDPLNQTCGGGQACIVVENDAPSCIPAGPGGEGVPCTSLGECAAGLLCTALAGSSPPDPVLTTDEVFISRGGLCRVFCVSGDPSRCRAGEVCGLLGLTTMAGVRTDVGVCATPP